MRRRAQRHLLVKITPRRPAWLPALLVLLVLLPALGGCEETLRFFGEKLNILDEEHQIANPSKDRGVATGKGCGETRGEALKSAQRVAEFNLRSLTGVRRYNIEFETQEEYQRKNNFCLVVSAQAIPW